MDYSLDYYFGSDNKVTTYDAGLIKSSSDVFLIFLFGAQYDAKTALLFGLFSKFLDHFSVMDLKFVTITVENHVPDWTTRDKQTTILIIPRKKDDRPVRELAMIRHVPFNEPMLGPGWREVMDTAVKEVLKDRDQQQQLVDKQRREKRQKIDADGRMLNVQREYVNHERQMMKESLEKKEEEQRKEIEGKKAVLKQVEDQLAAAKETVKLLVDKLDKGPLKVLKEVKQSIKEWLEAGVKVDNVLMELETPLAELDKFLEEIPLESFGRLPTEEKSISEPGSLERNRTEEKRKAMITPD